MNPTKLARILENARDRYGMGDDPTRIRDEEAKFGELDSRMAEIVKAELLILTRLLVDELRDVEA